MSGPGGGLRSAHSADALELREGVRAALTELCGPEVVRAGWEGPPAGLHSALVELGLPSLTISEDLGGMGLGALDWVLVAEELGRFCVPGPVAETMVLGPTLGELADLALLEHVRDGECTVTLGQAGAPCPHGAEVDQAFVLGPDEVFVTYRGATYAGPAGVPLASLDGSRRLARLELPLVPTEADVEGLTDRILLATAAQLLGLSRHMLDQTVAYAKVREQFGTPIGSFQAVQHHLADALLAIAFTAPLVYQAAWSVHHSATHRRLHVHLAKAKASECAALVGRVALQVHGAIAYTTEYDLHLWLKRAMALSAAWGDADHHLDHIASLLEAPGAPRDGLDFGVPHA